MFPLGSSPGFAPYLPSVLLSPLLTSPHTLPPRATCHPLTGGDSLEIWALGAGELGAGELGAGELGAGEQGAGELGAGELGAGELGTEELGAGELGAGELGAVELGAARAGSGSGRPIHCPIRRP
ncbi:unnamed protein product [Closterium sp. NIES-64]|nr:unnamed protein product [Closterium sp. NIES-64]